MTQSKKSPSNLSEIDLAVSASIFGVPELHRHCTLLNYRWQAAAFRETVTSHIGTLLRGERRNLLLHGSPGLGKTHLAVALYRWGILHWGTADCIFIAVPPFLDEVKKGFETREFGAPDAFADLEDAKKLVVLDDLFGRKPTGWELDHVIFKLLNITYTNGTPFIVTTNYSQAELAENLKPHEMSRLLHNTTVIAFTGKDQRLVR